MSLAEANQPISQASPLAQDALPFPVVTTTLDAVINWGRSNSMWPLTYATACCAIEFMSLMSPRYDFARFGTEFMRFTPRQADLLMVMGTITYKQAPILRRIYEQMAAPRWVLCAGACASTGGMYDAYCTVPGIDHIIPVDVFIGGCPPRPEAYIDAAIKLQEKIKDESFMRERLGRLRERGEDIPQ